MTPERKKYLAGISKEEIYIRRRIRQLKDAISDDKYALNNGTCMKWLRKICIRENKILIKALKKQLPAPKVVCETKYMVMISCPRCRIGDMLFGDYCPYCGQKLR